MFKKRLFSLILLSMICLPCQADEVDQLFKLAINRIADDDSERRALMFAQRAWIKTGGLEEEKKQLRVYKKRLLTDTREWAEEFFPEETHGVIGAIILTANIMGNGTINVPIRKDMRLRIGRQQVNFSYEW